MARVFFRLQSTELALLIFAVMAAFTIAGFPAGRYLREHSSSLREPFGVLQGALLGLVGLILAFGLSLAVGRYQDRRAATVAEANSIETTYLRAQFLAQPVRAQSLGLLRRYTDQAIAVTGEVPESDGMRALRQLRTCCSGSCGTSPAAPSPLRRSRPRRSCTSRPSTRCSTSRRWVVGARQPGARPRAGAGGDGCRRRSRAARAAHFAVGTWPGAADALYGDRVKSVTRLVMFVGGPWDGRSARYANLTESVPMTCTGGVYYFQHLVRGVAVYVFVAWSPAGLGGTSGRRRDMFWSSH